MSLLDNKYQLSDNQIGKGGFSEVYLGTRIEDDRKVAIKKVFLRNKKLKMTEMINSLTQEIEVMRKLDHPNIIKYFDVIKSEEYWFIILEYCENGTLDDIIKYNEKMSKENNFDREKNTFYYMKQLKDALVYLRNLGYVHRDIKPSNVLLKENVVKLCDFGLARKLNSDNLMETICGSPLYMAPELLINKKYDSHADLWSFGIIMYQMLVGKNPIAADSVSKLMNNLKNKKIDFDLNHKLSDECIDLLKCLLARNPESRIKWKTFSTHKWFQLWEKPISQPIHIIKKNNEPSPLGFSNLSRMKMNNVISSNNSRRNYSDYPESYPPSDPRRKTLENFGSYDNCSYLSKSLQDSLNDSKKSSFLGNSTINYHFFMDDL
jgi:serine/threonine protein kinase